MVPDCPERRVRLRKRPVRRAGLAVLSLAPVLALAGCGLGGPAYEAPPSGAAAVVEMTNGLNFDPATVTVPAGGVVEWRNTSLFTHTVTDDPSRAEDPDDVALPAEAEPFDSGEIAAGAIFRHRFAAPGTYRYTCGPHEGWGMQGTVVVVPRA